MKKEKRKKNFRHPPKKFGADTPPPRKFGSDTPPKIWSRHPPENLEQTPPQKIWSRHPLKIWVRHPPPKNMGQTPPENLGQTPPHVDRHTPVNLLPWPNFVAAGNKSKTSVSFSCGSNYGRNQHCVYYIKSNVGYVNLSITKLMYTGDDWMEELSGIPDCHQGGVAFSTKLSHGNCCDIGHTLTFYRIEFRVKLTFSQSRINSLFRVV